jgi:predicted  nucleic acid-binding Zn-ribbon protein
MTARCVQCYKTFTPEEVMGSDCCPGCGTKALPMNPADDIAIKINIYELRILGIWAENHANTTDNRHLDDIRHVPLKPTVDAITNRLRQQLKAIGKDAPLTLAAEFKEIEKKFPGSQLFRDGKEEI